jgi:hypothetical protein
MKMPSAETITPPAPLICPTAKVLTPSVLSTHASARKGWFNGVRW